MVQGQEETSGMQNKVSGLMQLINVSHRTIVLVAVGLILRKSVGGGVQLHQAIGG
jgi:hypothetical protein